MATRAYPPHPHACALCARPAYPGRPVRALGSPPLPAHPTCFRAARRTAAWWRRNRQRHGFTLHLRQHTAAGGEQG